MNSPMPLSHVSPPVAAQELLNRRLARQNLAPYIDYLGIGIKPATHHKLLIQQLEAVERGDIERLMILMPPGSAKSTYASVLFPPWFLGRNPQAAVLGVSNTTALAERFSKRARNIVATREHRNVFTHGVKDDAQSAGAWETEAGGEFFAAGVGSAIAGRRADLGLIDDPVKTREEADSEGTRDKHWDWYVNDFRTRLKPNARRILIMTRWHEDDLGGRILANEGGLWRVVKLPMLAVGDDPIGRLPGQRLWPEWFTEQMVKEAQTDVRSWNALYQQDPAPDEGDYFKREWFNAYDAAPPGMHVYGASDYAVTEGAGDFSEHGVFGLDFNGDLHVLDWWRGQTESDTWIERQCDLIGTWRPLIWFGEKGVIQKVIEPTLKRRMQERGTLCRLEWLPSVHDKVIRARAFQAKAAMGDVYLPKQAPWLPDLMSQLMRFPAGKYDDGVDVCSLIGRGLEHAKPPEMKKAPPKPEPSGVSQRVHGQSWMS